ncbi:MAG: phosphoglycerate dehydrogenase [Candidatus Elarobacter sp.]
MRVVFRAPIMAPQFAALAAARGADFVPVEDAAALHREAADADALWLWPAFYDAALVPVLERHAERLRWLQLFTMGYDQVDQHGAPRGVTIANAGDAYAPTVAEHAVTLLLALVRRLPDAQRLAVDHRWDQSITQRIGTLNDATVTVLGFGNIGRDIAVRLRGFGARVVAVTRGGAPQPLADATYAVGALHDALRTSDALIVAAPLTERTRRIVDAEALAALPPHAIVVNIARGGLIDHTALYAALAAGKLGGAGLDVTDPEPLPPDDPLWSHPDVTITPHVAGYGGTVAARRIMALVDRNLAAYAEGRPLEAVVFGGRTQPGP